MNHLKEKGFRLTVCILLSWVASVPVECQVLHYGVKGGGGVSWVSSDDKGFRDLMRIQPVARYQAGVVLSFKVKERFYLHTEYLFSTKGKINKGKLDPTLEDRVTYNYIEVPLLYDIHFKGAVGNRRQFKWYAGAGPLLSYWLGGKGRINSGEFVENGFPPLDYKVRFGERGEDAGETDLIYMKDVKRLQLGFNLGGGIMLEPSHAGKVMLDARFEIGHTWMGTPESADYVIPVTYDDNLKARNMGVRVSVMYLFERNVNKKVRNKGKSNLKMKGGMIQRKK